MYQPLEILFRIMLVLKLLIKKKKTVLLDITQGCRKQKFCLLILLLTAIYVDSIYA